MEVYLVISGVVYEPYDILGIFTDYAKARECELKNQSEYDWGYTEIRKVELDKVYDNVFGGIGVEV